MRVYLYGKWWDDYFGDFVPGKTWVVAEEIEGWTPGSHWRWSTEHPEYGPMLISNSPSSYFYGKAEELPEYLSEEERGVYLDELWDLMDHFVDDVTRNEVAAALDDLSVRVAEGKL